MRSFYDVQFEGPGRSLGTRCAPLGRLVCILCAWSFAPSALAALATLCVCRLLAVFFGAYKLYP